MSFSTSSARQALGENDAGPGKAQVVAMVGLALVVGQVQVGEIFQRRRRDHKAAAVEVDRDQADLAEGRGPLVNACVLAGLFVQSPTAPSGPDR